MNALNDACSHRTTLFVNTQRHPALISPCLFKIPTVTAASVHHSILYRYSPIAEEQSRSAEQMSTSALQMQTRWGQQTPTKDFTAHSNQLWRRTSGGSKWQQHSYLDWPNSANPCITLIFRHNFVHFCRITVEHQELLEKFDGSMRQESLCLKISNLKWPFPVTIELFILN